MQELRGLEERLLIAESDAADARGKLARRTHELHGSQSKLELMQRDLQVSSTREQLLLCGPARGLQTRVLLSHDLCATTAGSCCTRRAFCWLRLVSPRTDNGTRVAGTHRGVALQEVLEQRAVLNSVKSGLRASMAGLELPLSSLENRM